MEKNTPKKGLLLVSFGTSYPETCEKTIGALEREAAAAFSDWQVRRAFTSGMIRKKLWERDGCAVDSVSQALERMAQEGFAQVLCQPTHLIPGEEYEKILREAQPFAERFSWFRVGEALLSRPEEDGAFLQAVLEEYPLDVDQALVFMGHGSAHPANAVYARLQQELDRMGESRVRIGTVEGTPVLEEAMAPLRREKTPRLLLAPLMLVAGDHAQNDLAGGEEDSWKSILTAQGWQVQTVLRGLGELPAVRQLYRAKIRRALQD